MKYNYEEKLAAVLSVVERNESVLSAANRVGTNATHLRRWISRYQEHGSEGLRMKRYTYSGDFKLSVLQYMRENHLSLSETAAKFGIPHESTLSKWERIYYQEGESGLYRNNRGKMKSPSKKPRKPKLPHQVEEDLIAENQRLRTEVAYLKKLRALVEERIARESGKEPKPSKD